MKALHTFLLLISLSFMAKATIPFDENIIVSDFKLNGNEISWTTSKEIDNKEFIIESSFDQKSWTAIKHVKGETYSDIDREYDFQLTPPTQTTYYRLKRVDMEGKEEVYPKTLKYEVLMKKLYLNYEVEGHKIVFSTNDIDVKVTILDMTGNEVYNGMIEDGEELAVSEGVHFIKLKSAHQQYFKQVNIE